MGNLNCYEEKESEKAQIKTHNPSEFLNIDDQNFFIEYSLDSIPLEYSQTNKDQGLLLNSFDQINNTTKSFKLESQSKNYSKSFCSTQSLKFYKLMKNKSFPNFQTNKLINRSFSSKNKNKFKIRSNSKIIDCNKSQILKVITINNFFLQNNEITFGQLKDNSKYKKIKYLNVSNSKLTKEKIKNILATRIQRKYHSIKNRLNYRKNIRPKLIKESDIYIKKVLNMICSKDNPLLNEKENKIETYSLTNYSKFYKRNDPFFIYNYGKVFSNQIRIEKTSLQDLSLYQGEMNIENQKHGFGKLFTKDYTFIGTWRKNNFTGWGRKINNNGDYIEAKFINGLANGKGIIVNKNRSKYIGEFLNSIRCGKGELITKKIYYKGDFWNNMMHGYGNISFLIEGHKYEGQFKNNNIEGWGAFFWKNGDRYEGQVKDGKIHGKGKYYYKNGNVFEGVFVNGIKKNV